MRLGTTATWQGRVGTTTQQGSYQDMMQGLPWVTTQWGATMRASHLLSFSFIVIFVSSTKQYIYCTLNNDFKRLWWGTYFSDKLMKIISPSPLRGSLNVPSTVRDQVKCILASFLLDLVSGGFTVNIFHNIFHYIFQSIMSISLPNNQKMWLKMSWKRLKNVYHEQPYFCVDSGYHFQEGDKKWKLKLNKKWAKNGYCEQP